MRTEELGTTISKLRKEKGMTQKELAEKLYVSSSTVSKWEKNGVIPDVFMLKQLARILGVTLEELMSPAEKKETSTEIVTECSAEKELTPSKRLQGVKTKAWAVMAIILLIAAGIAGGYIYRYVFSKPSLEIVDEFYDDTSKHWGYESIYHVVVEYDGELDLDFISEYSAVLRQGYEHWFDKVVTIKISYFDEYIEREQVYNTDCHTFLFPRSK